MPGKGSGGAALHLPAAPGTRRDDARSLRAQEPSIPSRNICAGTAREARPAPSGFTLIKNKSHSARVRGAGLWLAQPVEKLFPVGTEKSLLSPPLDTIHHHAQSTQQGTLGSVGGKPSGNQKACIPVTRNSNFISIALTTFSNIPGQGGLHNSKNHLPSKRSSGEMYLPQNA